MNTASSVAVGARGFDAGRAGTDATIAASVVACGSVAAARRVAYRDGMAESELPGWVAALLAPGRAVRRLGGWWSATTAAVPATRYDRHARAYDRLVGSWGYNRFVWGSSTSSYTGFAARAVAEGAGPLLDLGCGTTLFTAEVYRASSRPVLLVDRSPGMLARVAERLAGVDPARVVLLQADLFDLPLQPDAFPTVVSYGLLHLFDDPASLLRVLDTQRAPGGAVYATGLIAGTALAGPVLRLLHAAGETAPPRRLGELARVARAELGPSVQVHREGGMAFLRSPG